MTENADVEWLRRVVDDEPIWLGTARARSLLAHIEQLEEDNNGMRDFIDHLKSNLEDKIDINVRPTVHEIAAQMMAALVASDDRCLLLETLANESYRAAEALAVEGRRRDGSL